MPEELGEGVVLERQGVQLESVRERGDEELLICPLRVVADTVIEVILNLTSNSLTVT